MFAELSWRQWAKGRKNAAVTLTLPFTQRWAVENSSARRVPSHGTDLLGQRYAIDFVGVHDGERDHEARRSQLALVSFRDFREWPRGTRHFQDRESGLPGEGAVVEPLPNQP